MIFVLFAKPTNECMGKKPMKKEDDHMPIITVVAKLSLYVAAVGNLISDKTVHKMTEIV